MRGPRDNRLQRSPPTFSTWRRILSRSTYAIPHDNKPPCKGRLLSKELLSKSFLSPDENVHRWVVEVTDSDQLLTEIRFSWDTSKLPPNFNLWIVDSAGRIDMKKPPSQPDSPRLYKLSMVSSDETKSFLICSQVTGVEVDNPCPKKLT